MGSRKGLGEVRHSPSPSPPLQCSSHSGGGGGLSKSKWVALSHRKNLETPVLQHSVLEHCGEEKKKERQSNIVMHIRDDFCCWPGTNKQEGKGRHLHDDDNSEVGRRF